MTPRVSVVIATHNRPERLAAQLACLAAQTVPDHEVIVVDDASQPPATGGDRLIRFERARGPAGARNAGWRAATAPLVAFTDDDCEADPRWLEELLRAWDGQADAFVQGATSPIERERGRGGPYSYSIDIPAASAECETCNIAYPRDLLERLGGFDETLRTGEDMELAWRARSHGASQVFAAGARVQHAVMVIGPRGMLRRAWGWSGAMKALSEHPELRHELLALRVFYNWSHYLLFRLLLALPFARRRWGWPLAWWLGRRLLFYEIARARNAGSLRSAPFWVLYDLAEVGACLRGSVRYRTLVI